MTPTFNLRILTACGALLVALAGCGGGGGAAPVGPPPGTPVAPTITAQPAPAIVADGATANFSVAASGDAPLAYQWRRNGIDLTDGAGVTGANTAALSLAAPYAINNSQISVQVANAAGSVTSTNVLLTVTPIAPTITVQPANTTVAVGAAVTFTVTVAGGTAPITYQWFRDSSPIAGATSASYQLPSAAAGDNNATFSVAITNPAGTLNSAPATLSVTAAARSWGPAVKLNTGTADSDPGYQQVAIDAAGNAIAVWQEETAGAVRNAVWASRYAAGGAWSTAGTIDNPVGNGIRPRIAMTPSGIAVTAFPQTTGNSSGPLDMVSSRYDGGWGPPLTIDDTANFLGAENAYVAVAPDGVATVVFTQSDGTIGRVWVARSTTAGVWGAATIADNGGMAYDPQVATAANGHTVITWVQQTGVNTRALWANRHTGSAWGTPVQITPDTGLLVSPIRVAIDANGNALAVWSQQMPSGRYAVRSTRLDAASGNWSAPVTLNDGARDTFEPQVAMDQNGNAVAVWNESNGVWSARYSATGAAWSAPGRVQPVGAPNGGVPKVGIDAAGRAIAIWLQPSPLNALRYELWAAHSDAAGVWGAPLKLMTDADAYAAIGTDMEPRIAVNANGEAVVVWYQRTDAPTTGIWARVYR